MCGICGELRFDGAPADMTAVAAMTERLRKRGPDSGDTYADGPLGMGHRRLAIIDLSERSNQPMVDHELGLAVVFNGAIYNYRELRRELRSRGYRFFSDGDTEVILKAYREWGSDCPRHLDGMFAFAIWDARQRSLFLARDRFGIKPLYYAPQTGGLRFASNTQALLAGGGIVRDLDAEALHFQFTLHAVVPAPRTILKGVRKLPPAHSLTIGPDGRQNLERYWHLEAQRPTEPLSDQEWVDAIHAALRQAVAKRNDVADVPVGVLLSGGLDSSLLVALLAEYGARDIRTFSVGFEDQPEEKGSEFEYSDQVVKRYGTRHHKFLVP
ncbi:MAG: asparagine synthase (glutamine-hydrolyzing), partial [Pseudomonadota bacterium]